MVTYKQGKHNLFKKIDWRIHSFPSEMKVPKMASCFFACKLLAQEFHHPCSCIKIFQLYKSLSTLSSINPGSSVPFLIELPLLCFANTACFVFFLLLFSLLCDAVLAALSLRGAAVKFLRCIDSMPDIKPGRKSLPLVISDLVRTRLKREDPTGSLYPIARIPQSLLGAQSNWCKRGLEICHVLQGLGIITIWYLYKCLFDKKAGQFV